MNNQFNNNFSQQGNSNNAQIFQPSYMQPKTQPVQQPINNNYINTQNNKSKNSKKVILIFLAILIIILCVIAFFYLKKDKNKNLETDITSSNVFFIKNEDNKYALFNDDGEQLTEFIFTSIDDFVNGTSLVRKDDAYGIIDSKGNMTEILALILI